MKKTVYTIAFIALFSVMCNAQDSHGKKEAPAKKETVNPDGTLSTTPNENATTAPKNEEKGGKPQTRMAITEKGVPASNSKKPAEKKAEPAKAEKH
jgi:hypothetical protein